MASLYGRNWTRENLLPYVGDVSQVARVKPYRLVEGHEDGVLAVDVTTGSGLDFTVLPSRGMDISSAHHNGRAMMWRSATSDQHPAFFEPEERRWLRSFYGGLVLTCGITWMGAHCTDEGEPLNIHGRISHIPATSVQWQGEWEGDDYILSVSGRMREAIVFGENIELRRRIWARMGEDRFFIEDTVENLGYKRTPHMILYHVNIGFPAVNDRSRLISPSVKVDARDQDAINDQENFNRQQPPTWNYREKAYFHTMKPQAGGGVTTAVYNPDLDGGFGVYLRYNHKELPFFTEWKMMDQGTYVVGMEPGNALVLGRDVERREGRLQFLEPGEKRSYRLEIGVILGEEQAKRIEEAARV